MMNSLLGYLEKTAAKFPQKKAIIDNDRSITFEQLRVKSIALATHIINTYNCFKKPILVYVPKSIESVISFMGILYSGNCYTPTDVEYPWEKVNGIINKLSPELFVSFGKYKEELINNGIDGNRIIDLELLENDEHNISVDRIIDTDIAYVLFTSGSTGVPKGVAVNHRSIIDYIEWAKKCFDINAEDSIGNQAPFYFDNSTLDIYLMLSTGATLYIIPKVYFSYPAKLMDYIQKNKINTVFWVPSIMINVANYKILDSIDCSCLERVLFAGEVMPNKQLNYWRKKLPNALYSNLYGPTEITVDCTYYIVDREFEDDEPLPIGRPCINSDVFVLDENNCLISKSNLPGELCVRGTSLAAGYWKDIEKTNEVFVQNPLQSEYPELIYRTGDIVYYNDNGELMFSGRRDSQIKHMGYRIELGEIEAVAGGCSGITNVCVLYDRNKKLITMLYQGDVLENDVKKYLMTIIPRYMVPMRYIKVDGFPYNDNGKIDRKKLEEEYLL